MKKAKSIFITGTQRSGTTLLCRILDTHPQLHIFNETIPMEIFDELIEKDNATSHLHSYLSHKGIIITKKNWGIKDPAFTYRLEEIMKAINWDDFFSLE